MKLCRNCNSKSNPPSHREFNPLPISKSTSDRSSNRQRSPQRPQTNSFSEEFSADSQATKRTLMMGQVKILKRGEKLTDVNSPKKISPDRKDDHRMMMMNFDYVKTSMDEVSTLILSADRLHPDLKMVPFQIRNSDPYAGFAFMISPLPSSLPLPVFLHKEERRRQP